MPDFVRDYGAEPDAVDGPPIMLVHGLMGRGATWRGHVGWLRRYGRVLTYDAPFHRGRADALAETRPMTTEMFVEDLRSVIEPLGKPAIVVGHSMGALHGFALAAAHPDLVHALVVEDIAVDFLGRTNRRLMPYFESWPQTFPSEAAVREFFGAPAAARYFINAFDHTEEGLTVHGDIHKWADLSAHWSSRSYWDQWESISCPTLLLEAQMSVIPAGQGQQMVARFSHPKLLSHHVLAGTGHLAHDDDPQQYRGAVEAFFAGLPSVSGSPHK